VTRQRTAARISGGRRGLRTEIILALLAALSIPAAGQVLELSAGDSTLMGGAGAQLRTYLPSATITTGAGFADGHFAAGASAAFAFRGFDVTAGDSAFSFAPSVGGLSEQVRGLTVSRARPSFTLAAFAGFTGDGYTFPYFAAVSPKHFGAGAFGKWRVSRWQFAALGALSGADRTATASAAYSGPVVDFSAAGGVAHGQRIATGAVSLHPSPHYALGAARQDLFWQGKAAAINSVSAFAAFGRFTANAAALSGTSAGKPVSGLSAGAAARFGAVTISSAWYRSGGAATFIQTATETFRHWQASETLTGARNFGMGGGYRGNRFRFRSIIRRRFFPSIADGGGSPPSTSLSESTQRRSGAASPCCPTQRRAIRWKVRHSRAAP